MIFIIYLLGFINFIYLYPMVPPKALEIQIECLEKQRTEVSASIVDMSPTLKNMITDLGGTIINDKGTVSISLENINSLLFPVPYYCSIINDLCDVLKDFSITKNLNPEKIKNYTLEKMITMSNAFHFFDFSENKNLAAQWN